MNNKLQSEVSIAIDLYLRQHRSEIVFQFNGKSLPVTEFSLDSPFDDNNASDDFLSNELSNVELTINSGYTVSYKKGDGIFTCASHPANTVELIVIADIRELTEDEKKAMPNHFEYEINIQSVQSPIVLPHI